MLIVRGISRIKKIEKPIVALGVFDGVHLGHKDILRAVVNKARGIKGTSVVLTFWPHPRMQASLYSLEHRLRLFAGLGIDVCIVMKFDKRFALIHAHNFVKNILFKKIGARYIYVGRNFRFGKNAQGDFRSLEKLGKEYDFEVKVFKILSLRGRPVSSTCIRVLIREGNLAAAQKLLTRPVSILGTVIKGISLARKLGFPTANIDPHHEVIPPSGVYAVKVIFNGKRLTGVCNIGTKPTFKRKGEKAQKHVELHIFDFKKNIYGNYLEIQFIKKVREERKFASPEELIKQIKKDIKTARRILSSH